MVCFLIGANEREGRNIELEMSVQSVRGREGIEEREKETLNEKRERVSKWCVIPN